MQINIAVELSEETSMKTKVSIRSFLDKNQWFNGTCYLLISSKFPISERTLTEIKTLHPNIETINVDTDERIWYLMDYQEQLVPNSLLGYLKLGVFLIEGSVLYISQKSIFLSNVSPFTEEPITISSIFSQDTSSIFYLDQRLDKNKLLSSIHKSMLDENQVPPNRKLNAVFSKELKNFPGVKTLLTDSIVSSSNYLDRYFNKIKNSLNQVSCIHFEDIVFNNPLYTKINQIWLHTARSITMSMSRPSANKSTSTALRTRTRPSVNQPASLNDNAFKVSIIVPAFKAGRYIKECLDSIKNQKTLATVEILVGIDNCQSTLSELKKIEHEYPNLRIFFSDKSIGAYVMRNSLVNFATHNNLLFFDADDIMHDNLIATILQKYNAARPIRFRYLNFNHGNNHKTTHTLNTKVSHGVFFISRKLFDRIGGFQNWPCGADTDFMKRCLNNKVFDMNLNIPLFYRRIHPASLTQNASTGYASKTRAEIANRIKNTRIWTVPIPRITSKLEKIK